MISFNIIDKCNRYNKLTCSSIRDKMIKVGKDRIFKGKLAILDALVTPNNFPQTITEDQLKNIGIISNGGRNGSILRSNGSFAQKYDFERLKEGKGTTVTGIIIRGYASVPLSRTNTPQEVRKFYRGKPCVFLGLIAGGMEIDHKDGWLCQGIGIDDFQPVCKSVNVSKRYYCNIICKPNGNRFDARSIGFKVGWTEGSSIRSQCGCHGCYLYDPITFRKEISKNYKKLT